MTNRKLDTDTHVFFYEQEFYVLSNFSAFNLFWSGRTFQTSEHAYQWTKFVGATDAMNVQIVRYAIQARIENAPSAHEAFRIAQEGRSYAVPYWDDVKVSIMKNILHEKARQHEYVRRKLLETGDREIVEDSWRDSFWGWGEDRKGKNVLGKLWMNVREELRKKEERS